MIQVHQYLQLELHQIYAQLHLIIYFIHLRVSKINIELVQHRQEQMHSMWMIIRDIICKKYNSCLVLMTDKMFTYSKNNGERCNIYIWKREQQWNDQDMFCPSNNK